MATTLRASRTAGDGSGAVETHGLLVSLLLLALVPLTSLLAPASSWGADEVPLLHDNGVYKVRATINGQLQKLFVLDSGASEVTVPEEVFLTLFPETVDPSDMLPGAVYRLADGRVVPGDRFRIRSLTVGAQTFENVPASVGPQGSPLLLGQGVLTRVGRWSIDNVRSVLILGEPAEGTAPSLPRTKATGDDEPSTASIEPVETIRLFYRLIADRRYHEAWALFASAFHDNPRADFGAWVRGFAETRSIDVTYAALKSRSDDTATVAVELVSIDGTAAGDISKRFAGSWDLVRDGGRWRLAHPNIRLVMASSPTPKDMGAANDVVPAADVNQHGHLAAPQPLSPFVQQTVPRLPDGLPSPVGASRDEVHRRLGQPSFEKDRGYWANTTIDMFDNVVPGWLALSYLYDTRTLRVRQAEATLPPWAGVDYLSAVIARMAGRSVGSSVQRALVAVGEQGARQAEFRVGSIQGTIERQDEARIFVAVWEPGTHRR
jgi:Aspartyl protease